MAAVSFFLSLEHAYRKLLAQAQVAKREEICAGLLDHDLYKWKAGVLQGMREAEALFEKALKETISN